MELKKQSMPTATRLKWKTGSLVVLLFLAMLATFGYHYSINASEQHKLENYSIRNAMVSQLVAIIGHRAKVRGLGVALLTENQGSPLLKAQIMRSLGNLDQAIMELRQSETDATDALNSSMRNHLRGWTENLKAFNQASEKVLSNNISVEEWFSLSNSLIEYELELNQHLLMPTSEIEWIRLFAELEQDSAALVHFGGQQRALGKSILIENKPISSAQKAALDSLNTKIDGYLAKLHAASTLDSLPLNLQNSLVLFRNLYQDQLKKNLMTITEESRAGLPYSIPPVDWWDQASNAIDAAESLANNAGQVMQDYLERMHSNQRSMSFQLIAEAIFQLVFIGLILAWLLSMLFRSISELNAKQAESHKYYRAILGSPVGVLICDNKGRVEFANEAFLQNNVTTLEELRGRFLIDVIDSEDNALIGQLNERIREGRSLRAELRCLTSVQGYDARLFVTPVKEEHGNEVVNYLAIIDNISEQKVLEKQLLKYQSELESEVEARTAELAESEARAHAIFDMAANAIITIDRTGAIKDLNSAAAEMLGYQPVQLIGQNVSILMPPPYSEEHDSYLANYLRTGERKIIGQNTEVAARHSSGRVFPIQLSISEVKTETDHFFVGMITDISERKAFEEGLRKAKEQAEQASDIKTSFLANISHEIRTPMNAIIGMTEVVLEGDIGSEQRKHLSIVLQSAKSLLEILNQVLDLAKLEDGSVGLSLTEFNLRGLINDVLSPFSFTAKASGLDFVIEIEDTLPTYYSGDTLRIRQVLSNLVGNAIKFTESGFVQVKLSKAEADRVRFEVIDSGIGIPDDVITHIFDSFTQADNSISRRFGGTGLGTTISKQLVELMGGTISVSSQLGIGSTFRFEVPLHTVGSPSTGVKAIAKQPTKIDRALSILVAEDQMANQELIKLRLQQLGHQVTLAADGRQAIRAYREGHFDLILMDVHMPKADGFEATRSIRRIETERKQDATPIVALSASVLKKEQEECRESGMDGFLAKPIDFALLQDTINSFFATDIVLPEQSDNQQQSPPEQRIPADQFAEYCNFQKGMNIWGDSELYSKTLQTFVSELPEDVKALREHKDSSLQEAKSRAHAIKGSAANLQLVRLADLCGRIESLVAKPAPDSNVLNQLINELETATEMTQQVVHSIIAPTIKPELSFETDNEERVLELLKLIKHAARSGQIESEALAELNEISAGDEIELVTSLIDNFAFDQTIELIDSLILKLDTAAKPEVMDEL